VLNVRVINIIRDFFTYFCDIFGGWSESYQDVTKDMENDMIAKAKNEARKLGANTVVGFALDYGSKNKPLLMASARCTAVVID